MAGSSDGLAALRRGDYTAALRDFLTLAEQGNASAQFNVGSIYDNGLGVPEDDHQALSWYHKAAMQNHAHAEFALGLMYGNGLSVPKDDRQAVFWYRKAAQHGHARAQTNLGLMYEWGKGVPRDEAAAVIWYRKAAERGFARAQTNLGFMYDYGKGVPIDDAAAAFWYRKAAEQGDPRAQANLGSMYANGEGIPEDDVHAYAWFNLAAAQGHTEAEQARIGSHRYMTRTEIAEAQKLSRELAAMIAEAGEESSPIFGSAPQNEQPKPASSGSGFLVGGQIVTNHHVVDGCARVTVHRAGTSHDVTVRAVDADDDLALLKGPPGEAAMFSESHRASLGEAVTVAGFPLRGLLSSELNVTSGNVSALAGPGDDPKLLQITAPVQQGNSGGPLLDGAGNVIGVVVSKLDAVHAAALTGDIPQNVNFAIKGTLVRSFLDIHGVAYGRRPSNSKLAPEQLAELAQTFTVAVHCWK